VLERGALRFSSHRPRAELGPVAAAAAP
jgi:hypothetical protein